MKVCSLITSTLLLGYVAAKDSGLRSATIREELPEHAQDRLLEVYDHFGIDHPENRELQLGGGIDQIVPLICNIVGSIVPFVDCTCSLTSETFSFSLQCGAQDRICFPDVTGFCTQPSVEASFSILGGLTFKFCADTATLGGATSPGLCIDFGGGLLLGPLNYIRTDEGTHKAMLTDCHAMAGEEECTSCEIGEDGVSYRFDCSEVDPNLKATEFQELWFPDGFLPDENNVFHLPLLDVYQPKHRKLQRNEDHPEHRELQRNEEHPEHRELQLLGALIAPICAIVGGIIPFVDCSCDLGEGLDLTFECEASSKICFPTVDGVCAQPGFQGQIGVFSQEIGFKFCANQLSLGGNPIPTGLCIDFGGEILTPTDFQTTKEGTHKAMLTKCHATAVVAGEEVEGCDCNIGADGVSYKFDCSNVNPDLKMDEFEELWFPDSLVPDKNNKFHLPLLAGLSKGED